MAERRTEITDVSTESARELVTFIKRASLAAMASRGA